MVKLTVILALALLSTGCSSLSKFASYSTPEAACQGNYDCLNPKDGGEGREFQVIRSFGLDPKKMFDELPDSEPDAYVIILEN